MDESFVRILRIDLVQELHIADAIRRVYYGGVQSAFTLLNAGYGWNDDFNFARIGAELFCVRCRLVKTTNERWK